MHFGDSRNHECFPLMVGYDSLRQVNIIVAVYIFMVKLLDVCLLIPEI